MAAVPGMSQATAQRRIEALEQALELETKRRHEEELRALLEGAPFVLHRGNDRTARHVWVADVPEKGGAMLRWQSNKGMSWTRSRTPRINLAKLPYHEASVALLTSVTYGAAAWSSVSRPRSPEFQSALQRAHVCWVWGVYVWPADVSACAAGGRLSLPVTVMPDCRFRFGAPGRGRVWRDESLVAASVVASRRFTQVPSLCATQVPLTHQWA